jgi:hypothetical protein
MGMPVLISDLPLNKNAGSLAGFVEWWTFRAAYNQISVTPLFSPLAHVKSFKVAALTFLA